MVMRFGKDYGTSAVLRLIPSEQRSEGRIHGAKGNIPVAEGDFVQKKGDYIMDEKKAAAPHDILAIMGVEATDIAVDEVQDVYRLQGVSED
jgi:hypothetical protein